MEDVIVLMSTYRGKKYLKEQIDSILEQDYAGRIFIFARDDGSGDGTAELLQTVKCPEERSISVCVGENIGPQNSFLELLRTAQDARYYFFADQDDIWDRDKVRLAVAAMKEKELADLGVGTGQEEPLCWCSNYQLLIGTDVQEEGVLRQEPSFTPLRIILYNQIPGCTMGFNFALMQEIRKIKLDTVIMHDSFVLSLTAACGTILYDPCPRITHRIHGGNVVGSGHKKIVPSEWIREKASLLKNGEPYDLSKMAEQFLEVIPESELKYGEDLHLLRDFKKSIGMTRKLLQHSDGQGEDPFDRTTLSVRSKILFHLF